MHEEHQHIPHAVYKTILFKVTPSYVPEECKNYLTEGRVYDVVEKEADGLWWVIDDEGNTILARISNCLHLGGHHWNIITDEKEERDMKSLTDLKEGDTIHVVEGVAVNGTSFYDDESLTVVAVHKDIGHVVFQGEDGFIGITSLENVKEGVGPSMNKPYEFEGVVEFDGAFDLDDVDDKGVEINTSSGFDEAYNLTSGREYHVTVRIEEKG